MKTLSDILNIEISYMPVSEDTYLTYRIVDVNEIIFVGLFFAQAGTSSINVCLNDIIASRFSNDNILESISDVNTVTKRKIKTFDIVVLQDGQTLSAGSLEVYMGYKYPFKDYFLENPNTYSESNLIYPALVGVNHKEGEPMWEQTLDLMPHYPNRSSLKFVQRLIRNDIYRTVPYSLVSELDKDKKSIATISRRVLSGRDSTCILYNSAFSSNCEYVGILNSAVQKTEITGEKLWKVTIAGQWIYNNGDVFGFVNAMGYPGEFYTKHFYVQLLSYEELYLTVLTNDPENDIQEVWDEWAPDNITMSYEEVPPSSSSFTAINASLEYEPKGSEPVSELNYQEIKNFFSELSGGYIDDEILKSWHIEVGKSMAEFTQLVFPFDVPDFEQLRTWQNYFESYTTSTTFSYEDLFWDDPDWLGFRAHKQNTYKETHVNMPIVFAKIDQCPAKYYVQWIDRLGGVQCQPFDGKEIKSISYNSISITNNLGKKRPISFDNTLNFELNTRYISDKEMPCYEGLFVSPFIKLLDTENNKVYDVVNVTNKYQEKTFDNQGKRMYNLTIQLNCDRNENIVY